MLTSALFMSFLTVIAGLVSFGNQILLANYFGAGPDMDLLLASIAAPMMITSLITAALGYSLVPELVRLKATTGLRYSRFVCDLFRVCNYAMVAIVVLLMLVWWATSPFCINDSGCTGFSSGRRLFLVALLAGVFGVNLALMSSILNAHEKFIWTATLTLTAYIATLIITFGFVSRFGVFAAVFAILGGSFISSVIAWRLVKRYVIWTSSSRQSRRQVWEYCAGMWFAFIGSLTFTVHQTVDAFWAPTIGPASMSYMGYISRLMIAIGSLILAGPSVVLVPRLTRAFEEADLTEFYFYVTQALKLTFIISSVAATILIVLRRDITRIFFERGNFTAIDTVNVSNLFPAMFTSMVFMSLVVVMFRILYVMRYKLLLALLGIFTVIFYWSASGLLLQKFQTQGLALAYLLNWQVLAIICLFFVYKGYSNLLCYEEMFVALIKHVAAVLPMVLVLIQSNALLSSIIKTSSVEYAALGVMLVTIAGLGTYLAVAVYVVRLSEVRFLFNRFLW